VTREIGHARGGSDAEASVVGGTYAPRVGDGAEVHYRSGVRELLLDEYEQVRAASHGECIRSFQEARRLGGVPRPMIAEMRERHWV
jgi:hypothetical protein